MALENNESNKKKRKPRIVKGGYINLDDVYVGPGELYENWIFYVKIKLKEREKKLMQIRINKIKKTILSSINKFEKENNNKNIIISKDLICSYFENTLNNKNLICLTMIELNKILLCWDGIQINQTSKDLSSFRLYFNTSRNWFDQKKKKLKGMHFWLNILESIQQFVLKIATDFIDNYYAEIHYKYYTYLFRQIIYDICTENICFAATKAQPLLPSGMIKDIQCIKKFINDYLGKYLNIHQISNIKIGEKKLNANKIRSVFIERLYESLKNDKKQFNDAINKYYIQQNQNQNQNQNQLQYHHQHQHEYQSQYEYEYELQHQHQPQFISSSPSSSSSSKSQQENVNNNNNSNNSNNNNSNNNNNNNDIDKYLNSYFVPPTYNNPDCNQYTRSLSTSSSVQDIRFNPYQMNQYESI